MRRLLPLLLVAVVVGLVAGCGTVVTDAALDRCVDALMLPRDYERENVAPADYANALAHADGTCKAAAKADPEAFLAEWSD